MLAETLPTLDSLPSLSASALIGAMWLWERRQSAERERQLDDAHARILADKVQLDALIDLVQQSTETLAKLGAQQDALLRKLDAAAADRRGG
ncbi:MAG: hypothetical protein ACTHM6_08850 [Tepidisphaeraceae bacterium]